MKVLLAESVGFCFGVKRAVKLAFTAAKRNPQMVYTIGPLIHNPQVVDKLERAGVKVQNDYRRLKTGIVIIRAHGISPQLQAGLERKGLKLIDATCPFVKKAQNYAKRLCQADYKVVIVGERQHPEVQAILGYSKDNACVVNGVAEAKDVSFSKKIGIVAQTTQHFDNFQRVVFELLSKANEFRVYNTICAATVKSQKSTLQLARKVDIIIVVGGHNSANTCRLVKICKGEGVETHHIEVADELKGVWFKGRKKVGVTAGASTPDWIIQQVVKTLKRR